jgi:hypothetical protein
VTMPAKIIRDRKRVRGIPRGDRMRGRVEGNSLYINEISAVRLPAHPLTQWRHP